MLFPQLRKQKKQIKHSYSQNQQGARLRMERIGGNTHQQREDRSAEQAHDHQAGDFVLSLRHRKQRLREQNGEHIRVAVTDQSDANI